MAKVSGEYLPLSVLGEFPSDWSESTLEEVCHQVTDGTHDSPKPVDEGGYPLVTGKAIKDRRVDFSVTYNISDAEHQKVIERSKPERDDILFANIGNSIGDLVRVQTDRPFSIKNVALFKPNPSKVSARYLEYFLLSEQVQGFIKGSTRGSAQPFIGLGSLRGFPVPLPPMNEQLSIGALLGALDDRITLLRETNATLETIAQALFKSWFVDFDPVRAKAEDRQPEGMDATIAALFPDSFEESELSLVPKGWRVGTVEDLCSHITNGGTPSRARKDFWDGGSIPWFKTGEFCDGFLLEPSERITEGGVNGSSVKVLPRDAVLMAIYAAPTVGRLGVLTEPSTFNQACTGMVAKDFVGPWFLFLTLFFGRDWFNSRANGAAQQNISKAIVAGYSVVIPDTRVLSAFNELADALFSKLRAGAEQAQTLTQLRDTLLARLISGQLRLPETEALLEEAL
jgi:type I restriction enzyme S subunit